MKFPSGGRISRGRFLDQSLSFLGRGSRKVDKAILGITQVKNVDPHEERWKNTNVDQVDTQASGRIAVFADSNCIDSSSRGHRNCLAPERVGQVCRLCRIDSP